MAMQNTSTVNEKPACTLNTVVPDGLLSLLSLSSMSECLC